MPAPRQPSDPLGPDWRALIEEALTEPERLVLAFQPIVSLSEATIVGYEALTRFHPSPQLWAEGQRPPPPDQWFTVADRLGFGAEMEAIVIRRCLELRTDLPPNCFLTINVSPHLITDPLISDLLTAGNSLAPLIIELTEHEHVADLAPLVRLRDRISMLGGLMALDDAGSGYSGLQQMTRVRPNMIKLDRALVEGIDQDETKLALAELLGEFAGRIDAWLLAEGIETWEELNSFIRMGVPLGQGYLLGRPAPPWAQLDPVVADAIRRQNQRASFTEHVASLVEGAPFTHADNLGGAPDPNPAQASDSAIEVDEFIRPVALLVPNPDGISGPRRRPVSLRVSPSASVVDTARRILARDPRYRFDPVVCIDERGRALGLIRVERILHQLLTPHPERWPADR